MSVTHHWLRLFACLALGCSSVPVDETEETALERGSATADAGGAAAASSVRVIPLGALRPGARLSFEVPRGALGFTLAVVAADDKELGIRELTSPNGRRVVDRYVPEGGTRPLGRATRGAATVGIPASTRTASGEAIAGRWSAIVDGPAGAPMTLRIQSTADGAFHGGALDLDVYVPEGLVVQDPEAPHAVTAAAAPRDASIGARVDMFYSFLQHHVGIGRGEVRFHPIDARYRRAATGDERAALLTAPAAPHAGLAVVLTNEMSYGGGETLLGYSTGLPGFADGVADAHAAIGVALYKDGSVKNDALTLFHELGHFVGLMHTSEEDGTVDLFDDTPTCGGAATTACADADNLMASAGPAGPPKLSPAQIRVFRGAPLYRASATGSAAPPASPTRAP